MPKIPELNKVSLTLDGICISAHKPNEWLIGRIENEFRARIVKNDEGFYVMRRTAPMEPVLTTAHVSYHKAERLALDWLRSRQESRQVTLDDVLGK